MNKITPGVSLNKTPEPAPGGRSGPINKSRKEAKITRRQFLGRGIGAIIGAGLMTGGYAWQGEPNWLDIVRLELPLPKLPPAFNGMKVVHFSDTHLGFNKDADDLAVLVSRILQEVPDLICFTGDIVDSNAEDLIAAVPTLSELAAPLGKYAILGNHDYKNTELLTRLWKEAGFHVLRNESVLIKRGQSSIALAGIEDMLEGEPDPEAAARGIPPDTFAILLMHEPDYALTAEAYPFHLQLSGHSHGGQIRLPLMGAIFTPTGAQKYIAGLYYTGNTGMRVYVNRGFGETYMPFRLLCRPELSVLTLRRT